MLRKYPILKWSLLSLLSLIILVVSFGFWFMSLLPEAEQQANLKQTLPTSLPYLTTALPEERGKILAIVTSCQTMGASAKPTGYELTELARPYYVFQANGFELDVASPQGGMAPMVLDDEDMGAYDYAFLNDTRAQQKVKNTLPLEAVDPEAYAAVYFVGGKGAMFDFPNNPAIQALVSAYAESGKVIGAVCHGPAALLNVELSDGRPLLANTTVSAFTNEEELFIIPDAANIFPFLLEDALMAKGARIKKAPMYLEAVSQDGNLITGQNPWSTWAFAEAMVRQLGYTPKARPVTAEENSVSILLDYHAQGYRSAFSKTEELFSKSLPVDRRLLAMHALLAGLQGKLSSSADFIRLLAYAKSQAER